MVVRHFGVTSVCSSTSTMPYEASNACEEVVVRLIRLIAALLIAAAALSFVARLLKPRPVLRDTEGDLGYVGPVPADGPAVSVADAVPLLPEPRLPSDETAHVG
jgi:hypothetical protein